MLLSTLNSFDSRKTNTNGNTVTVPFVGTYEIVDIYEGVYIFVVTEFNDTVTVLFDDINFSLIHLFKNFFSFPKNFNSFTDMIFFFIKILFYL